MSKPSINIYPCLIKTKCDTAYQCLNPILIRGEVVRHRVQNKNVGLRLGLHPEANRAGRTCRAEEEVLPATRGMAEGAIKVGTTGMDTVDIAAADSPVHHLLHVHRIPPVSGLIKLFSLGLGVGGYHCHLTTELFFKRPFSYALITWLEAKFVERSPISSNSLICRTFLTHFGSNSFPTITSTSTSFSEGLKLPPVTRDKLLESATFKFLPAATFPVAQSSIWEIRHSLGQPGMKEFDSYSPIGVQNSTLIAITSWICSTPYRTLSSTSISYNLMSIVGGSVRALIAPIYPTSINITCSTLNLMFDWQRHKPNSQLSPGVHPETIRVLALLSAAAGTLIIATATIATSGTSVSIAKKSYRSYLPSASWAWRLSWFCSRTTRVGSHHQSKLVGSRLPFEG